MNQIIMNSRLTTSLRAASVISMALVMAACSSAGGPSDSSRAGVNVGGSQKDFSGDVRYVSLQDRYSLQLENVHDHTESWLLSYIKPEIGVYRCNDSADRGTAITLISSNPLSGSSAFGGDCVIEVTQADSQGFSGIFSGTIVQTAEPGAKRYNVSNGEFDVVFANAIPDADKDGLSDADDNCPFDANINQSDSDADGVGDACTSSEEDSSAPFAFPFG